MAAKSSKPQAKDQAKATASTPSPKPLEPQAAAGKGKLWLFLLPLLLAGLTWFSYMPALDNDFVDWDDYTYVINNALVRDAKMPQAELWKRPISLNYHPLTITSMRWHNNTCPTCFEGISARPFIQGNILLHILNTILLFFWLRSLLGGSLWRAAWIAGVFALHPMHIESVAWVSERKDVLYVLFFFIGLLLYEGYSKNGKKWMLWAALPVFVLACLAKAMAVVLPLVFVLVDYWRHEGEKSYWRSGLLPSVLRLIPFWLVALFFGLMAVKVQGGGNFLNLLTIEGDRIVAINDFNTFSLWQRVVFASYGFSMYLYKFFLPFNLSTYYPYPTQPEYDGGLIFKVIFLVPLLILAGAWFLQKRTKVLLFGFGFYLATVILVLQFLSVGAVIMADRYTYLPYVGFAFVLAQGAYAHLPKAWHKPIYALGLLGLLGFIPLSRQQIDTWQDSETLWTHVISLYPNIEQAYSIRGNFFGKKASKAKDEAERKLYMEKAYADFEKAVALNTDRPEVFEGLGNIHGMRGEFDKALEQYSKVIASGKDKGSIYFNRGVTYSFLNRFEEAAADYTVAMQRFPERRQEALANRALAYLQAKIWDKCLADYTELLQKDPNNADYLLNAGFAKENLGDIAGAKANYQRALQINPQSQPAQLRLKALEGR